MDVNVVGCLLLLLQLLLLLPLYRLCPRCRWRAAVRTWYSSGDCVCIIEAPCTG